MPAYTPTLGLYKPGGGSSGSIVPDEPVDIDKLNGNFDLLDAAAGIKRVTTATRPTNPFNGMVVYNSTTDLIEQYNGSTWSTILPTYLAKSTVTGYGTSITSINNTLTALQTDSTTTGSVVSGWTLQRFFLRKRNGFVTVDLDVTRSGSAITSGPTGNIVNVQIGTVPSGWGPEFQYGGLGSGPGGPTCSVYVDSSNKVWLAALPPNYTVSVGSEISAGGGWQAAS